MNSPSPIVRAVIAIGRTCALIFGLAATLMFGAETPSKSPASEVDVKAAFVLNFIRLVVWEDGPGADRDSDLTLCALANSDFADAVRRVVVGKTAGNRSISFKFDPNPNPSRCRILIVDIAQYQIALTAINAVKDAPVLTIGSGPGLRHLGGMFDLIAEDRKIQFDANLEAVRRANLNVSAKLLQLSRNLKRGGGRGI